MLTIQAALAKAVELEAATDTARLDTEVLLMHALSVERAYLYTWPEKVLSSAQSAQFEALLVQRQKGVPVAHLVGCQEFWSLSLKVSTQTLIPRPETELLVQLALQLFSPPAVRIVADIGTGTGAVALALAMERPAWQVTASDCSGAVVALAEQNRAQLALANVTCLVSDWCEALPALSYDLVISNPPYIDPQDPHLACGDLRFEPRSALVAEEAGLADIKCIVAQARRVLRTEGYLLLEHGWNQAAQVRNILAQAGYRQISSYRDLGNRERATLGQWSGGCYER